MIRSSTVIAVSAFLTLQVQAQTPTTIVLDAFDSVTQWTTAPADGVEISVHPDSNGGHGKAMRV
ncbi:MAG TPA: hypothetical protein VKB91_08860, partial [Gemmatimonadaceae bacterium]|nr:hypothetical protein [Gemmatimonadaceae bacterium]